MHTRLRIRLILVLVAILAVPVLASAQSDVEANAGVQFNFSTPGARSLGMGGSFLASVDDATAAYSNPAGLLQLSKPEALVEARRWHYETPFAERGRASGTPTGRGIDTQSGVSLGTAESEIDGISYAAFVLPRPKWAFAVYYHRVADFESSFSTDGIFARTFGDEYRLFPAQSTYDLEISQAGVSFAKEWNNGLAVGVSVSAYSFLLDSLTQRYGIVNTEPPNFSPGNRVNFQTQTGDDQKVGAIVGLLWDRGGKVSTGMVYRFAPKFDVDILHSTPQQDFLFEGVFNLPDVFGAGITFRPSQAVTVNLDLNYVLYSQMIEEFVVIFPNFPDGRIDAEDFILEDVTQYHAGFEYLTTGLRFPIAFRLGAWYDPDHRLRVESGPALSQALFFAGEDQVHGTAGLGLTFGGFQVDAALDVSDISTTSTVSASFRF